MIRHAKASDIAEVGRLYYSVWHETHAPLMPSPEISRRSLEFFVNRMTPLLGSTLVMEQHGLLAAFSAWEDDILSQLFVTARYRGTSMASALLMATEGEMAKHGTTAAELHCVVGNERARRFYQRMGWVIAKRVSSDETSARVPFWRMKKVLRR